jgi:hypothetical protein
MSKSVFWPYIALSIADTLLANIWKVFAPESQWGTYLSCAEFRVSMLFLCAAIAVIVRIKPTRLGAILLFMHASINCKEVADHLIHNNYQSPAPELTAYAWVLIVIVLAKIFIGDRPIKRSDSLPLS